jgi:hypothetical protein
MQIVLKTHIYSYAAPLSGEHNKTNISPAPEGTSPVADIHSHGCFEENYINDEISKQDTYGNQKKKIDGYVTTPDGSLIKYDVDKDEPNVISTDLPSDPNDPNRQNNISPTSEVMPKKEKEI